MSRICNSLEHAMEHGWEVLTLCDSDTRPKVYESFKKSGLFDVRFYESKEYEMLRLCTMHIPEGGVKRLRKGRTVALACPKELLRLCPLIELARKRSFVVDATGKL